MYSCLAPKRCDSCNACCEISSSLEVRFTHHDSNTNFVPLTKHNTIFFSAARLQQVPLLLRLINQVNGGDISRFYAILYVMSSRNGGAPALVVFPFIYSIVPDHEEANKIK